MSFSRPLFRPVAAAIVLAVPVTFVTALPARAAAWSEWQPIADRYQGAVDFRFRTAGKKEQPTLEYQLRNRYPQKVTYKMLFEGVGASGATESIEQITVLDAGDAKSGKIGATQKLTLRGLTSADVLSATFDGPTPAPTPEGQPGSTAFLEKRLAAAREDLRAAQIVMNQAQQQVAATAQAQSVSQRPRNDVDGALSISTLSGMSGAQGTFDAAKARVNASQERVTALERQLQAMRASATATAPSTSPPAAPTAPSVTAPSVSARSGVTAPVPAPGKPLSAQEFNALMEAADKSFGAGEWSKAAESLQAALAGAAPGVLKDGDRAALNGNLGLAYRKAANPAKAEAAYREAVRLLPTSGALRNDLASTLLDQKRPAEAEAALAEAVRLQPSSALYQDNLGISRMAQKKWAEAETAFREAVRLDPSKAEYKTHLKDAQQGKGK
ncbi:MAG: tetratricopeptide repeat protein [Cytophagales bacterium]|nr:tetratricopeptide repeat protein [Armatimonadota bacterium]